MGVKKEECSFCGSTYKLIYGPSVSICESCVQECNDVIENRRCNHG